MNTPCRASRSSSGRALSAATVLMLGLVAGQAQADGFSGYYAPANWVVTNTTSSSGTMDASGAPAVLKFISADNDSGLKSDTYFGITAPADGQVSFDWRFSSVDELYSDQGLFFIGSTSNFFTLGPVLGSSGHITFDIAKGQLFGFNVISTDSMYGPGTLTITSFEAPLAATAPVPEPATYALMGLGLGLLALRRRAH